jgi:hypothetical protein
METLTSHRLTGDEKPAPLDLSHLYSVVTKRRLPSQIKRAYKFFQIPGILNAAGGACSLLSQFLAPYVSLITAPFQFGF